MFFDINIYTYIYLYTYACTLRLSAWARSLSPLTRLFSDPCLESSLLGPVDPSFRALSGRLKFTVRRHKFDKHSLSWSRTLHAPSGWLNRTWFVPGGERRPQGLAPRKVAFSQLPAFNAPRVHDLGVRVLGLDNSFPKNKPVTNSGNILSKTHSNLGAPYVGGS